MGRRGTLSGTRVFTSASHAPDSQPAKHPGFAHPLPAQTGVYVRTESQPTTQSLPARGAFVVRTIGTRICVLRLTSIRVADAPLRSCLPWPGHENRPGLL